MTLTGSQLPRSTIQNQNQSGATPSPGGQLDDVKEGAQLRAKPRRTATACRSPGLTLTHIEHGHTLRPRPWPLRPRRTRHLCPPRPRRTHTGRWGPGAHTLAAGAQAHAQHLWPLRDHVPDHVPTHRPECP